MTWANEGILGVTEGFNDPSQLPPEVPDIAETESLDGIAGLSAELDGTAPNPDGAAPESIAAAGAIGASLEQPSSPIMALDGPVSPAAQTYNGTIRIVDGFAVEPTDYNWNSIALAIDALEDGYRLLIAATNSPASSLQLDLGDLEDITIEGTATYNRLTIISNAESITFVDLRLLCTVNIYNPLVTLTNSSATLTIVGDCLISNLSSPDSAITIGTGIRANNLTINGALDNPRLSISVGDLGIRCDAQTLELNDLNVSIFAGNNTAIIFYENVDHFLTFNNCGQMSLDGHQRAIWFVGDVGLTSTVSFNDSSPGTSFGDCITIGHDLKINQSGSPIRLRSSNAVGINMWAFGSSVLDLSGVQDELLIYGGTNALLLVGSIELKLGAQDVRFIGGQIEVQPGLDHIPYNGIKSIIQDISITLSTLGGELYFESDKGHGICTVGELEPLPGIITTVFRHLTLSGPVVVHSLGAPGYKGIDVGGISLAASASLAVNNPTTEDFSLEFDGTPAGQNWTLDGGLTFASGYTAASNPVVVVVPRNTVSAGSVIYGDKTVVIDPDYKLNGSDGFWVDGDIDLVDGDVLEIISEDTPAALVTITVKGNALINGNQLNYSSLKIVAESGTATIQNLLMISNDFSPLELYSNASMSFLGNNFFATTEGPTLFMNEDSTVIVPSGSSLTLDNFSALMTICGDGQLNFNINGTLLVDDAQEGLSQLSPAAINSWPVFDYHGGPLTINKSGNGTMTVVAGVFCAGINVYAGTLNITHPKYNAISVPYFYFDTVTNTIFVAAGARLECGPIANTITTLYGPAVNNDFSLTIVNAGIISIDSSNSELDGISSPHALHVDNSGEMTIEAGSASAVRCFADGQFDLANSGSFTAIGGTGGSALSGASTLGLAGNGATTIWNNSTGDETEAFSSLPEGYQWSLDGSGAGVVFTGGTNARSIDMQVIIPAGSMAKVSLEVAEEVLVAPVIIGPVAMVIVEGYAATSSPAFTVTGDPEPVVAVDGDAAITWNPVTSRLDFAAGLDPGDYHVTLTATNGVEPDAIVTFTLTVEPATVTGTAPIIIGPSGMVLAEGYASTSSAAFTVTGDPEPAVAATGDDAIVWNPETSRLDIAAGLQPGEYVVVLTATNGVEPDASISFTLTVEPAPGTAPSITGPEGITLEVGYEATSSEPFTVTGDPQPTVSVSGGEGKVSWNPVTSCLDIAAGIELTCDVVLTASNGIEPDATFTFSVFTYIVDYTFPPEIDGPTAMTITEGYAATSSGEFTVTGLPNPEVSVTANVAITWNPDTSRLDIAAGLAPGDYVVTMTASNGVEPDATFTFTLTVEPAPGTAPSISGPDGIWLEIGYEPTFSAFFTVTGDPQPTVSVSGGEGKVTWNPATSRLEIAGGITNTSQVVLTASNGVEPDAVFNFSVILYIVDYNYPPTINGPSAMTLTEGYAAVSSGEFFVTGLPIPEVAVTGDAAITWNPDTFRLDIAAGLAPGEYPVTLTASNGIVPDAHLAFTLTVEPATVTGIAPVITGPSVLELEEGYTATSSAAFTVTGDPEPIVTLTGDAAITWNPDTYRLDIAAGLEPGEYPVVLTASNGIEPDATVTFTLTVEPATVTGTAPVVTGPSVMTLEEGYTATSSAAFTVTGDPEPVVTLTGDAAIIWNPDTFRLDIAAGLEPGEYVVTLTATNGVEPDATVTFTLTVEPATVTGTAPAITGPADIWLESGYEATSSATFTVTGDPEPIVSVSGGEGKVTWNVDTFRLDIAAGIENSCQVTLTATNGVEPDATFDFSIVIYIVDNTFPPTIDGPAEMTLEEGYAATSSGEFTVTGLPDPEVTLTGDAAITWNADTSCLDIAVGLAAGEYQVTLTASNGVEPDAIFTLTLTVEPATMTGTAPSITGPQGISLEDGYEATASEPFTVTGDPQPTVSVSGGEGKVTWNPETSRLDIAAGIEYSCWVTLTASNGVEPDATFVFEIGIYIVDYVFPPVIVGPTAMTLQEGYAAASSAAFTVTGEPRPIVTATGNPAITWNADTNRLDIAAGLEAGEYQVTLTATNDVEPDATANFTLTVETATVIGTAPVITGPSAMTLEEGYAATYSAAFTVTGDPQPIMAISSNTAISWNPETSRLSIAAGITAGEYYAIMTASNGVEPDATVIFTLTVEPATTTGTAPSITGPEGISLESGYEATSSDPFTVTGSPQPTVSVNGGEGKVAWNPVASRLEIDAGIMYTCEVVLTASNGVEPDAVFSFTVAIYIVDYTFPPTIDGPSAMTLNEGYSAVSSGEFTVTGLPDPEVSVTGNPAITWNPETSRLDIAAGLAPGEYPVTLTAANGVEPDATVTFTLTIEPVTTAGTAPVIIGPSAMTLEEGYTATSSAPFTVTGDPEPTVSVSGGGGKVTWNQSTSRLSVAAGLAPGEYPVTLTAANGIEPDATVTFTLTIEPAATTGTAPSITGPEGISLESGYEATSSDPFTVTGDPQPTVSVSGGEGKVAWNPTTSRLDIAAGIEYSCDVTLTASNGVEPDATFIFVVGIYIVDYVYPPTIEGPTAMTLTEGYTASSSGLFTVTGDPEPTVSITANPAITWNAESFRLDIAAGLAPGEYQVTITATNDVEPDATFAFTLTVLPAGTTGTAPVVTGPSSMVLTKGYAAAASAPFTVTGDPQPTVVKTSGNTAITWNSDTSRLEIAAGLAVGEYEVTLTASNGVEPDATVTFTLTVEPAPGIAPTITGPTSITLQSGYSFIYSDAFVITGDPAPTVVKLSGDPTIVWNETTKQIEVYAGLAAGSYPIVLKATNGIAPDAEHVFTVIIEAPEQEVPPTIIGPVGGQTELFLSAGYATVYTAPFTITGSPMPTITKVMGDDLISWDDANQRLEIAAGLAPGAHLVVLLAANGVEPDMVLTFVVNIQGSDGPGIAPTITGQTNVLLVQGYPATSTPAFTIGGVPTPTVTKLSGDAAFTWNPVTQKIDIAPGLGAGSYIVVLLVSNGIAPEAFLTVNIMVVDTSAYMPPLTGDVVDTVGMAVVAMEFMLGVGLLVLRRLLVTRKTAKAIYK